MILKAIGRLSLVLLPAFCMLQSGCNSSGCTDLQSSLPKAGFYDAQSGKAIAVSNINVAGVGAPHDSILYLSGSTNLSEVYLPLQSNKQSTQYRFIYGKITSETVVDDLPSDIVTINYSSHPYFASEECGAMYSYTINSISHTSLLIDSIALVDSVVTNTDVERIKIYFNIESGQ